MKRIKFFAFFLLIVLFVLGPGAVWAQSDDPPPQEEPGVGEEAIEPAAVDALITMAFSGGPAFDSGWQALGRGKSLVLRHHLGGNLNDYVVIMDYKANSANGINQRYYGGADFGTHPPPGMSANDRAGAYWRSLTTNAVTVYRRPEDRYADWVRIRIWLDPYPDYDSGWIGISPGGAATTLHHNLGGNANDYVVDMQYRSSGSGVNQRYYGGNDFGAKAFHGSRNNHRVGLYWRTLTNSVITLYRRPNDDYAPQVRVRIWKRPRPTYDSGWVSLNPGQALALAHHIGGNADDYVVDMQYKASDVHGVNQRYYGGADFGAHPPSGMHENDRVGAYWRSLTNDRIVIYRRPNDIYAPKIRIRIWRYWQPTPPDYDSGWRTINPGQVKTLNHHLNGSQTHYLVDMQYKVNGSDGVNQRYYGGADFGAHPAPGHAAEDRVGVYWRTLTNNSITLFRRAEDTYAARVRVRIWRMPKPDYDSGWVSINKNQVKTLTHNLKGSVYDYLVDLEYETGSQGINQRYYGGMDIGSKHAAGLHTNDRVGAYWRSLNNVSISVYRRPEDIYASKMRVRIWRMARPSYDSSWVIINQNQAKSLMHRLRGNPDNYLLQMWQYDATYNFVNQRHYGGADFGANPPSGYTENSRVGAYWRSLNRDSITIYRRPQDGFADRVRVRIWDYNQRQYLPMFRK